MTLSDYETFVAIAESKSITWAAQKLYLTKSAISHTLSKIEKEIGTPLFNRSNLEWSLTAAGKQLLPLAYSVLRANGRFEDAVYGLRNLESGSVSIGAPSSVCINWIPDILNGFRALHPNVKVSVKGGLNNVRIADLLEKNEIDIGIAAEPFAKNSSKLEFTELYSDEMLCVTSSDFVPKHPRTISQEELESMRLIMPHGGFGTDALPVLELYGIVPDTFMEALDDASLIAMVAGGLGYTILGELAFRGNNQNVVSYSFSPKQFRKLAILYNGLIPLSPACKALHAFIKEYVAELASAGEKE